MCRITCVVCGERGYLYRRKRVSREYTIIELDCSCDGETRRILYLRCKTCLEKDLEEEARNKIKWEEQESKYHDLARRAKTP